MRSFSSRWSFIAVVALTMSFLGLIAPTSLAAPVDRIEICHPTGSATNPYVYIEINKNAWRAHEARGAYRATSEADCNPQLNQPPIAVDDYVETDHDTHVTVNVLWNDSDPDGGVLSVTAVDSSSLQGGTAVNNGDGTVTYTPPDGFSGDDSFTYTISDGQGGFATATVFVRVLAPSPPPPLCGDIVGIVTDATTGAGILGASVEVLGTSFTATTDGAGNYSFTCVPTGSYTVQASAVEFSPGTTSAFVPADESVLANLSLIPRARCDIFIVLTWGATPEDLDAHLSGPKTTGDRFHVYWNDQNPVPYASLDVDNLDRFGPETISVTRISSGDYVPGEYRYWVHDYTNRLDFAQFAISNAVVTVNQCGVQLDQFSVSNASGDNELTIWHVFNFVLAADGTMTFSPIQGFQGGSASTEL